MTSLNEATPLCNNEIELPLGEHKTREQCGKSFTARSGSGGKPQRFCSSECRTASRSSSQCASSQCTDDQQNDVKTPMCETLGTSPEQDSEEFAWSGEDVVIGEQPATAIYFNPQGALVIRQKATNDYQIGDPFVYIGCQHIEAFIERLCDVCGVKNFP